jgi:hypothetical protein
MHLRPMTRAARLPARLPAHLPARPPACLPAQPQALLPLVSLALAHAVVHGRALHVPAALALASYSSTVNVFRLAAARAAANRFRRPLA